MINVCNAFHGKWSTGSLIFYLSILTLFVGSACSSSYKLADHLQDLEGIWIAEDYLRSFDSTGSSIRSKKAFDHDLPVGLRINRAEINNGMLNIGYSRLHDHLLHPEVSGFAVVGGDTIPEQGSFSVDVEKKNPYKAYKTSMIYYFNEESKSYLSWRFSLDTVLILFRVAKWGAPKKTIRYKRVSASFTPDYPFPNPLYYYIRSRALVGNYILKDSLDRIVSTDFQIGVDGKTKGYLPFQDKAFHLSTDIYCGPPTFEDHVVGCSMSEKLEFDCDVYIYKRLDNSTIHFYKLEWEEEEEREVVGKLMFTLVKK